LLSLYLGKPLKLNKRHEELVRWWHLSHDSDVDAAYPSIRAYANDQIPGRSEPDDPDYFVDVVLQSIYKRLDECSARCPKDFRKWCCRQIDKVATKLARKTAGEKRERKGTKNFEHVQHGERCFIKVEDQRGRVYVWTIPTTWLEHARLLWPVYIRHGRTGPYVSRKVAAIYPDGRRVQRDQAIHQLFLGSTEGDTIFTRDGNWLNYCDNNLFLAQGTDALDRPTVMADVIEFKHLSAFDPKRTWRTPSGNAA
jgi:hypothetical protein